MGLFVSHLIQAGALSFWVLLRTGNAGELVPMAVLLGGVGHFILFCATLLAIIRIDVRTRKWWEFAGGSALSMAYFALLVALFQPHWWSTSRWLKPLVTGSGVLVTDPASGRLKQPTTAQLASL